MCLRVWLTWVHLGVSLLVTVCCWLWWGGTGRQHVSVFVLYYSSGDWRKELEEGRSDFSAQYKCIIGLCHSELS